MKSPTPNTTDADKPELPADGCSTKFIFAFLKDGRWWEDISQADDQKTLMELRLPELVEEKEPDDMRLIVRTTTELFIEV